MPLIVAIERDRRQADLLAGLVRQYLSADLIVADSTKAALKALSDRVPDLILTSMLLSPKDEAALADRLRELDAAGAHVQTLVIPVFASGTAPGRSARRRGLLTRLRGTPSDSASEGCEPSVFAAQIKEYLDHVAADKANAASLDDEHLEDSHVIDSASLEPAPSSSEPYDPPQWNPDPFVPPITNAERPMAWHLGPGTGPEGAERDFSEFTQPDQLAAIQDQFSAPAAAIPRPSTQAPGMEAVNLMAFVEELEREIVPDAPSNAAEPAEAAATGPASVDDLMALEVSDIVDFNLEEWLEEAGGSPETPDQEPSDDRRAETSMPTDALMTEDDHDLSEFLVADAVDSVETDQTPDTEPAPVAPEPEPAIDLTIPITPEADPELAEFLALVTGEESISSDQLSEPDRLPEPEQLSSVEEPPAAIDTADEAWPQEDPMFAQGAASTPDAAASTIPDEVETPAPGNVVAEPVPPVTPSSADRPEWLDLLSAIRRDIEQLRADLPLSSTGHAAHPSEAASKKKLRNKNRKRKQAMKEDWGFFDPDHIGFSALVAKLDEISRG